MTTARTAKSKPSTSNSVSTTKPPTAKAARSRKKTVSGPEPAPQKPVAKTTKNSSKAVGAAGGAPAIAIPSNPSADRANRLDRISSLFVGESGTDDYVIFGEHGPVLWSQSLEFQPADLNLWRRMILDPAAQAGTTWRHNYRGQSLVYGFGPATEIGHVLAQVPEEEARRIDPEVNPAEFTIFVGARYGKLFMVFAGSPNSFADCDFQGIYDTLRGCGVLG